MWGLEKSSQAAFEKRLNSALALKVANRSCGSFLGSLKKPTACIGPSNHRLMRAVTLCQLDAKGPSFSPGEDRAGDYAESKDFRE